MLVRSTVAHARILGIDASAARAMPGVVAVLTGDEAIPLVEPVPSSVDPTPIGGHLAEIRCLAVDRVRHVGEPVAAVVAETQGDALAAALAVRVDLEPLPLVLDADEAMADDAPLLYPEWGTNRIVGGEMGSSAEEVDAAFAAADHVLEGVLRSHRGNAAPMETRTHVASWDETTGRLTMWATTQNPHPLRSTLASALRLSEAQVHVIAPKIGGSFGLKMFGNREDFIVPVLARLVGRPVRWHEERAAALLPGAREQVQRWRAAFAADGRLLALDVHARSDHGAVSAGPRVGDGAGRRADHRHRLRARGLPRAPGTSSRRTRRRGAGRSPTARTARRSWPSTSWTASPRPPESIRPRSGAATSCSRTPSRTSTRRAWSSTAATTRARWTWRSAAPATPSCRRSASGPARRAAAWGSGWASS